MRNDWVSSYEFGLTPALRRAWIRIDLSKATPIGVLGKHRQLTLSRAL